MGSISIGGRLNLRAPDGRTFSRVKVPKSPGSGRILPKARVSIVRRNLEKAGFRGQRFPDGQTLPVVPVKMWALFLNSVPTV